MCVYLVAASDFFRKANDFFYGHWEDYDGSILSNYRFCQNTSGTKQIKAYFPVPSFVTPPIYITSVFIQNYNVSIHFNFVCLKEISWHRTSTRWDDSVYGV